MQHPKQLHRHKPATYKGTQDMGCSTYQEPIASQADIYRSFILSIGIYQGHCIGLEGIGNGTLSTSGTACSCNLFIYMSRMWGVHQRFSSTKREGGVHLFLGVYVHHSQSTSTFVESDSDNGCTTSFRSTYIYLVGFFSMDSKPTYIITNAVPVKSNITQYYLDPAQTF